MAQIFGPGFNAAMEDSFDWDGNTYKVMLTTNAYTHSDGNADTYDYLNDVSANRCSGTTDQALPATVDMTIDTTNNYCYFNCGASVTFSAVAGGSTVTGVMLFQDSGVESTSELLAWLDFSGGGIATNGSDIQVNFDSNGVMRLTY